MLNPERYTDDLFDDQRLPDYKLRGFAQDHLLRLVIPANNPGGIYTTIIADTTSKFNAFFGSMDSEASKEAFSEGLSLNMENAKATAISEIVRFEGLVTFQFGKTSAAYQAFYPQGLTEYHKATISEVPGLFTRFYTAATTYLNATHPADVTNLDALFTAFNNARSAQLTALAEIDLLQTGRRDDRKALTLQLTTNMLTIALNNLGNPDNYNNYYNPAYLPMVEAALSVSGLIPASSTVIAVDEGVITQSSNLTFYNNGTEDLLFSLNDQRGVIHPNFTVTVQPGNHLRYTETLPVFEKYYVNIQNPSTVSNGKWKVVIG